MIKKKKYFPILIIFIIMIYSLLNMINLELISDIYDNYFYKQIIWFIFGYIIVFICSKFNIKLLFNYSFHLYIVSIILLLLVLFLGIEVNGTKAWFDLGFMSFQPSELTKLTLTLYLSNIANEFNQKKSKKEFLFLLKIFIITLIPSFLVFIEPDTGAIIFYLIILSVTIFNLKISKKWLILFICIIIIFIALFFYLYFFNTDLLINLIGTSFFYRIERLFSFNDNYQIINALILIGSASSFGVGINQMNLYVPEAGTDFIYAFNIGNFGIINGVIITLLYFIFSFILLKSIKKANNKLFTKIFIALFLFQTIYNIFMTIGLLPIMGIPLPFLSYGGSSLIIYFLFLGIYLKNLDYL